MVKERVVMCREREREKKKMRKKSYVPEGVQRKETRSDVKNKEE